MTMDEDIYSPSVEEFRLALIAFVLAVSSVAFHRGREFGPQRMAYIARHLADEFSNRITERDAALMMADFPEASRTSLGALFEELVYIACRYSKSARDAGIELVIPGNTAVFDGEMGNVFSDEALDDIETVKDSISWLLEKMPKWAQRIVEALLEALKLTRGG
jgi:hypothetical protein